MSERKRELWPIGVVSALVLFMAFIVTCAVIMMREEVPMVTENYYEKELHFQEQINKENLTSAMGKKLSFFLDKNAGQLDIHFPLSEEMIASGEVYFFRPSDDKLDFTMAISPDPEGLHRIDVSALQKGYWIVSVDWKEGDLAYYSENKIML